MIWPNQQQTKPGAWTHRMFRMRNRLSSLNGSTRRWKNLSRSSINIQTSGSFFATAIFPVSDVSSRTVQIHDILLNLKTTEDSLTVVYLCERFFRLPFFFPSSSAIKTTRHRLFADARPRMLALKISVSVAYLGALGHAPLWQQFVYTIEKIGKHGLPPLCKY